MKIQKHLLFFLFLFFVHLAYNQCLNNTNAFGYGEKVTLTAAYNWGILWVNAGEVWFSTDSIEQDGKTMLKLSSFGKSYNFYDLFFKVRDSIVAIVNPEPFLPQWFLRDTYEGGYKVDNEFIFDHSQKQIYSLTSSSEKPPERDTLNFPDCTFDVLSGVYYARNIDFSECRIQDTIPIRVVIDGDLFELYIRYLGKEIIKNRDGQKYKCVKFSVLLVEGTIFKGGEDLVVWVTDDRNKIPVMVEAKILIGSVKAYLSEFKGLKYEMDACINN